LVAGTALISIEYVPALTFHGLHLNRKALVLAWLRSSGLVAGCRCALSWHHDKSRLHANRPLGLALSVMSAALAAWRDARKSTGARNACHVQCACGSNCQWQRPTSTHNHSQKPVSLRGSRTGKPTS